MGKRSKGTRSAPRLWVVADQKPDVTGVFYQAMARCLVPAGVGVQYQFTDLGKLRGFPDEAARKAAARFGGKANESDAVLVVFDVEASSREEIARAREEGEAFGTCLAHALDMSRGQVLIEITAPTTEAIYLLDEPMLHAA